VTGSRRCSAESPISRVVELPCYVHISLHAAPSRGGAAGWLRHAVQARGPGVRCARRLPAGRAVGRAQAAKQTVGG
jgi:hypothetical protein